MNSDGIASYTVVEQLRDKRPVTIRAIRPDDKERFREAFNGLEANTIYMRFFGPRKELTDGELAKATEVDFIRTVALVACVQKGAGEQIVGGGRYIVFEEPDTLSAAEIAFMVEEDYQGQGIASILLKHLLLIGRKQGISRFEADVLHANKKMLRVFERTGLPVVKKVSSDAIHVTILLSQ